MKDGQPQSKIKPPTVKLAMRRVLQGHVRVYLPTEQAGASLPLGE